MATKSTPALTETSTPRAEEHENKESLAAIDMDDLELTEDDLTLSTNTQLAAKKLDTRRKIEMYWEKKRLQEQLGDNYGEVDFDF